MDPLAQKDINARFSMLAHQPDDFLARILEQGELSNPSELVGWEYDGWCNRRLSRVVSIRKFRKGFQRQDDGRITGYNVEMETNAFSRKWQERSTMDGPRFYRFFEAYPAKEDPRCNAFPRALLLNYKTRMNGLPVEWVRDYVVEAVPGDPRLLVGVLHVHPDLELGRYKLYSPWGLMPVYFLLKRAAAVEPARDDLIKNRFYR